MSNNPAYTELEKIEKDLISKLKGVQSTMTMLSQMYNNGEFPSSNGNELSILDKYSDFDKKATFRDKLTFVLEQKTDFFMLERLPKFCTILSQKMMLRKFLLNFLPLLHF